MFLKRPILDTHASDATPKTREKAAHWLIPEFGKAACRARRSKRDCLRTLNKTPVVSDFGHSDFEFLKRAAWPTEIKLVRFVMSQKNRTNYHR